MATTNLDIAEVAENQNQKEVTINNALEALDVATQGELALTITTDVTLTAAQFVGAFMMSLVGTPAAAFALTVPGTARFFAVKNATGQACTVTLGTSTVVVANGAATAIYSNGTDLTEL